MVIEFLNRYPKEHHNDFQKWRRKTAKGYFLNFQTNIEALIHLATCRHFNDRFLEVTNFSLTKRRKVCSNDQAELLSWAKRQSITITRCEHCIGIRLTRKRTTHITYHVYGLKQVPVDQVNGVVTAKKILQALEGIAREVKAMIRSRSRPLRDAALERAKGKCEVCLVDFSRTLSGLGLRILQVHHRDQLALTDEPVITSIDDLAVVCANCHILIHSDMAKAIKVESLRRMLAKL